MKLHLHPTTHKVLWVVRILLGLGMLAFGIMKLAAAGNAEMVQMVGSAGHAMWLTFLSITAWFWIAAIWETLAGAFLLTGHWYKYGAILTIIIMIFAINAAGPMVNAIGFLVAAVLILWMGPGAWMICKCKSCKACCDRCCGTNHMQQQQ